MMMYGKLLAQRVELAKAPELWQFDLLNAQELCGFARERNIHIFNAETVTALWQSGLLRADLIQSKSRLEDQSLKVVPTDNGFLTYCDHRQVEHRREGYGGIFAKVKRATSEFELLFHPFRLYVLYHIERVFQSHTSATQYLLNPEGIVRLARGDVQHLDQWTSSEKFVERFEHWNRTDVPPGNSRSLR